MAALLEADRVAKKTSSSQGGRREGAGRPAPPGGAREHILGIRGTAEYKAWVLGLSEHCRLTLADTIDQALVELARARGFSKAAPKR